MTRLAVEIFSFLVVLAAIVGSGRALIHAARMERDAARPRVRSETRTGCHRNPLKDAPGREKAIRDWQARMRALHVRGEMSV